MTKSKMKATKWVIDPEQSDVLIKTKRSNSVYLAGKTNTFNGSISVVDDELQDAAVEFLFYISIKGKKANRFDSNLKSEDVIEAGQNSMVRFKSTTFQKVNSNINFLRGNLTLNNITKVIELDVILTGLETKNGNSKVVFELLGNINRKDFGLSYTAYSQNLGVFLGKDINLTANIEFTTQTRLN